jgi:hypothetical protein
MGSNFDCSVQRNDIFFKVVGGQIGEVLIDLASDGIKKDARKTKSPWHWVHPLYDPEKRRHEAEILSDNSGGTKEHVHSRKYRGNHRSETGGIGIMAWLRYISHSKKSEKP